MSSSSHLGSNYDDGEDRVRSGSGATQQRSVCESEEGWFRIRSGSILSAGSFFMGLMK